MLLVTLMFLSVKKVVAFQFATGAIKFCVNFSLRLATSPRVSSETTQWKGRERTRHRKRGESKGGMRQR